MNRLDEICFAHFRRKSTPVEAFPPKSIKSPVARNHRGVSVGQHRDGWQGTLIC